MSKEKVSPNKNYKHGLCNYSLKHIAQDPGFGTAYHLAKDLMAALKKIEGLMEDILPNAEMGSSNKYKKLEGKDLERIEKLINPNEKQQLEVLKQLVIELFDEASWDVFDSIQNTACKLGIFRRTSEGYELADWLKGE